MLQTVPQDPNLLKQGTLTPHYPAIEALIDTGDFKETNTGFAEIYDKLEHILQENKGFGRSMQARKAICSLELTVDLLRHLLTIKRQLAAKGAPKPIAEASKVRA